MRRIVKWVIFEKKLIEFLSIKLIKKTLESLKETSTKNYKVF